eukprot:gene8785-9687_t
MEARNQRTVDEIARWARGNRPVDVSNPAPFEHIKQEESGQGDKPGL